MGTGYIPPPSVPPSIGWDVPAPSNAPVSPLAGVLRIAPGSGLVGRVSGGELRLDAAQVDPPRTFNLFAPGIVAAKTLGIIANTRLTDRMLIDILEANALTAQTTADAANFFGVTLTGATSGSLTLPFATAAAKHFISNHSQGVAIRDNGASGGNNPSATPGFAYPFTPGATTTVTGFSARVGCQDTGNHAIAGTVTGRLLDDNMNEIPGTAFTVAAPLGVSQLFFPFPLSQVLAAGTRVWFACDTLNDPAGPLNHLLLFANGNADANPSGRQMHGNVTSWTPLATNVDTFNGPAMPVQVFGQGSQVQLIGDVTVAYTATGAPIASAAPSDVNIRIDIIAG